jgi:peptidoglycan/xylan/chitin deacetylase (PgdA/CDA1 family)
MGLTASFFITTAHIDQKVDFVTRKQIRRMSENGMSIGSHTHNHKFLDELSPGEIFEELRQSKTCLEDIIGREISFLSCPGGRYNSAVIDIAANIGYRGVFTSVPTSKIFDDAILVSGRFLIDSTVQLHTFIQIVNLHTMYIAKERLEYTLKSAIKKTIGNSAYHKVWRKISTSSEP